MKKILLGLILMSCWALAQQPMTYISSDLTLGATCSGSNPQLQLNTNDGKLFSCSATSGWVLVGQGVNLTTYTGATSGSATISVPAIAGSPDTILLPTATGAANSVLQSAGDSSGNQQTSWGATTGTGNVLRASAAPPVQFCGTTTTCSHTIEVSPQVVFGSVALGSASPSVAAITGISPAFTSASTYSCTLNDQTTRTDQVVVLAAGYVSGSAFTITGPNTVTDVINYICVGY